MKKFGQSLARVIERSRILKQVYKKDVHFGDLVIVNTHNSTYSVRVLSHGRYLVSGGWFDLHGLSPVKTSITGCTWGGSVIKLDILAACGLCLEFGNRVVTSPIQKVTVIKYTEQN
ncbi:hypothetical protein GWO43_30680 [candidate division KSB1 bacterium]|nr:hypothetical protein [candidate division KSB1 bacterium]NIR73002.1 hypothetical protein [candidate division KSB1 bacterium]NIS28276.1 hypothetical protein [candidate division KSB1 bacterium]NIT75148.1 hypothetical protein [candidate division KSB1 bacterium]NIU28955.1 hypothetical protein [candidate division KSB1 bacterium]